MQASDIMTRTLVTVRPDAAIADAIRLMLEQHVSGLPVVDAGGGLAGIVTEGDLLRRVETGTERPRSAWRQFLRGPSRLAEDYIRSHGRKVAEVMSTEVESVAPSTPIEAIVELMEKRRIKRVPVVEDGRLVGVVSRADLLRVLERELAQVAVPASGDAALRDQVIEALRQQPWIGLARVTVLAVDGMICLKGVVYDEPARRAMLVAAENVPGVRGVEDQVQYIDPAGSMMYGA